jgi:hypothetical protein
VVVRADVLVNLGDNAVPAAVIIDISLCRLEVKVVVAVIIVVVIIIIRDVCLFVCDFWLRPRSAEGRINSSPTGYDVFLLGRVYIFLVIIFRIGNVFDG